MFKFYTAVGQLQLITDSNDNKRPIIKLNGKIHEMNKSELIIWTSLMWHISDFEELYKVFQQKIDEDAFEVSRDIIQGDFIRTLERLIYRELVVMAEDEVGTASIYSLISDLIVIPSTANIFTTTTAFLKFVFIDNIPLGKAKKVFKKGKLNREEKMILKLIKKYQLEVNELICIMKNYKSNRFVYCYENLTELKERDLSNFNLLDITPVLSTICNLYLKKLIQFQ